MNETEHVPTPNRVNAAIRIINHREILSMQGIALSDEVCVAYHEALAIVRAYIAEEGNQATRKRDERAKNSAPPNKENNDAQRGEIFKEKRWPSGADAKHTDDGQRLHHRDD